MENNGKGWSVPVAVEDIPETGLHMEIEAPGPIRGELAELAGVNEVLGLSAGFDLVRQGATVAVTGQVRARVGQTCVVTLEPMESAIAESVDLKYASASSGTAGPGLARGSVKQGSEEPPEPLVSGQIDLGALATEFLILGIDPYPRKPGAEFAAPKAEDNREHPFAALEALKKRLGGES